MKKLFNVCMGIALMNCAYASSECFKYLETITGQAQIKARIVQFKNDLADHYDEYVETIPKRERTKTAKRSVKTKDEILDEIFEKVVPDELFQYSHPVNFFHLIFQLIEQKRLLGVDVEQLISEETYQFLKHNSTDLQNTLNQLASFSRKHSLPPREGVPTVWNSYKKLVIDRVSSSFTSRFKRIGNKPLVSRSRDFFIENVVGDNFLISQTHKYYPKYDIYREFLYTWNDRVQRDHLVKGTPYSVTNEERKARQYWESVVDDNDYADIKELISIAQLNQAKINRGYSRQPKGTAVYDRYRDSSGIKLTDSRRRTLSDYLFRQSRMSLVDQFQRYLDNRPGRGRLGDRRKTQLVHFYVEEFLVKNRLMSSKKALISQIEATIKSRKTSPEEAGMLGVVREYIAQMHPNSLEYYAQEAQNYFLSNYREVRSDYPFD